MTIIGLTGMRITTFEERMVSNTKDKHTAFEAAEAAMMGGETYVEDNVVTLGTFDGDGSDGMYDDTLEEIWKVVDWDSSVTANTNEAFDHSIFGSTYGVNTSPRYVIQHYATFSQDGDKLNLDNYGQGIGAGEINMFRVTSRGTGGNDDTVVILQSTYGKQL